jgi:hypothetical protein
MVFVVPCESDRAGAGKEGTDLFGLNLSRINFRSDASAEGIQDIALTFVAFTERLSPVNILTDQSV